MEQPTVKDIIEKLELILKGKLSREEVADWASEYVMADDPSISDEVVWEFLQIVSGVDLKDTPDEYLHWDPDIIQWINKYQNL
ncbi:DNA-binding protein [Bacillus sp. V3-13]|uniref:DNA-binding protein n=1 Tax=Bacillus sp. V3-13 TaxID=2053728 RepID=UPI000C780868|nr:DNA-binding protein [Bacillus sp. V3-13]PLR77510.1 DNA-binding protein [Bacillus sp. V3-13]